MPNRRKLFFSYSRESSRVAEELVADLHGMGHTVWLDRHLGGGQDWWERILEEIRLADIFVFVLDQNSVKSMYCLAELGYASKLEKPLLPVQIAELSLGLVPQEIGKRQVVNHINSDRKSALDLARAFNGLAPRPLPDRLPETPRLPVSLVGKLAARIGTSDELSRQEQMALVSELETLQSDPKASADVTELFRQFRERDDILAVVARKIDELLKKSPSPPKAPAPLVSTKDYWVDPATSLMWTKWDNGKDIWYEDAVAYAASRRLGGFSDWRLPTIQELTSVYDPTAQTLVKGGIELTGPWQWSSDLAPGGAAALRLFRWGGRRRRWRRARVVCTPCRGLMPFTPASPAESNSHKHPSAAYPVH